MRTKAFYIIHNVSDAQNQAIAESEEDFLKKVKRELGEVMDVDRFKIATSSELLERLEFITSKKAYHEIYLHFSTHGKSQGINFGKWLVETGDFSKVLATDKRIKFCFFASCLSDKLAEKVATHVPIAIGTLTEIENTFSIAFQTKFYELLLDTAKKNTFQTAFDGSLTFMKETEAFRLKIKDKNLDGATAIVRGGGHISDFVIPKLNIIQPFFREESDKNNYLVYPTIVDEMDALPSTQPILMVYSNSENSIDEFQKFYIESRKNDLARMVRVVNKNLPSLIGHDGQYFLSSREHLKVLLILNNEESLSSNFIKIFDKSDIGSMMNLKIRIAYRDGLDVSTLLKKTSFLKKIETIKFDDLEDLETQDAFGDFISENDIPYSVRNDYTFEFPCIPTKDGIENNIDETSLCLFYFPNSMQRLGHFLINYVKSFIIEELRYPFFRIKREFGNKEEDLKAILKGKIFDYLSKFTEHKRNRSFEKLVEAIALIEDSLIIVWQLTENDNKEEVKSCLEDFVKSFKDGIDGFEEFNPIPSYFFIFYPDNENVQKHLFPANGNRVFAGFAEKPDAVDVQLKNWKKALPKKTSIKKVTDQIIKNIEEKNPSDLPTTIELICEGFGIPHKNFLYIS